MRFALTAAFLACIVSAAVFTSTAGATHSKVSRVHVAHALGPRQFTLGPCTYTPDLPRTTGISLHETGYGEAYITCSAPANAPAYVCTQILVSLFVTSESCYFGNFYLLKGQTIHIEGPGLTASGPCPVPFTFASRIRDGAKTHSSTSPSIC